MLLQVKVLTNSSKKIQTAELDSLLDSKFKHFEAKIKNVVCQAVSNLSFAEQSPKQIRTNKNKTERRHHARVLKSKERFQF